MTKLDCITNFILYFYMIYNPLDVWVLWCAVVHSASFKKSYWNSPYLEPTHIILMTAWTHFWTLGIKGESTFGSSLVLYLHNNLTISRYSLIFWILSVHDLPPRRWWHSVCRLFSKSLFLGIQFRCPIYVLSFKPVIFIRAQCRLMLRIWRKATVLL